MDDKPIRPLNIPITGRLRTSVDGTQLGEGDFQVLQNMRYTNAGIKSIGGMTKINTSASIEPTLTYPKFKSGIHFIKDEPTESHVLVQAWNSGETASKIYRNDTAIPTAGNFNTTPLYTESSGADIGTFSNAPDGCVAYCNGKESLIWGGDEYRVGAFFDVSTNGYNEKGIQSVDITNSNINYTTPIKNTLQTIGNVAYFRYYKIYYQTAYQKMLLKFDTDLNDIAGHSMTGNGGIAIDTSEKKYGAASCYFDGADDYITTPDHADFDLSSGWWDISFWMKAVSPTVTTTGQIYYQQIDVNNYLSIYYKVDMTVTPTTRRIYLKIVAASAITVNASADVSAGEWNHVLIAKRYSGTNHYSIFVNGILSGYSTDAGAAADYTSLVYIGATNVPSNFYNGWLDDFRIRKDVGNGDDIYNFVPPQMGINDTVNRSHALLGSVLPLQCINIYITDGNGNTTTSSAACSTWNGKKFENLIISSDTTSLAGVALAQTGKISFNSAVNISKIKAVDDALAYWYLLTWEGLDGAGISGITTIPIYHITVDAPMQKIKDVWDGIKRVCYAFFNNTTDNTSNVSQSDYLSSDATTYSTLDNFAISSALYAGFSERITALYFDLPEEHRNLTNGTIMTIYYWNGSGWATVGIIDDGTSGVTGATTKICSSFDKSGYVSWDPTVIYDECTKVIAGYSAPLYYYKIVFSQTLSADVKLDYVAGVPAPKIISNYKLPVSFHNRLWLCSDQSGERNKITISSIGTISIWNGTDSANFYIGDNTDIIAGGSLYGRYASSISEQLILCKQNETWLIDGTALSNYNLFRVSNQYGCIAPKTFTICNIGYNLASGISKHVAIWQASNAIVVFDGSSVVPVHFDIMDVFDQRNTLKIHQSMTHKSTAFYDEANNEWHWCWSSDGTTLDKEYVYDLVRQKWYTINRGTGKAIQLGIPVRDTNGNNYAYGAIISGYLERLENGNTFDTVNIESKFRTPDIPISGWNEESLIRKVSLLTKTKAITTNKVAITHYGDMVNTGTSIGSLSVTDANKRVIRNMLSISTNPYTFHSFECSMTTSDEPIGFEPIGLQIYYKLIREHLI